MVTVVLIFNSLLALLCLYVAWQVCRLRNALANVADALIAAEHTTHRVLHNAPHHISKRQACTYQLRRDYYHLTLQMQKVQQVLALLGLGRFLWQQYQQKYTVRQWIPRSSSGSAEATIGDGAIAPGGEPLRPRSRRNSARKSLRERRL
ncbi:hypothetical protein [Egbenema bharatensis]|uniref:hypothetical protein n=1 Tax=Egbenema bharatensis TaxID=3463334 RepID=UPI003A876F26